MPFSSAEELVKLWDFDWPVVDVLISGKSSIDLKFVTILSREEATRFVRNYGYNPDKSADARFIHAVIVEALHFIHQHLMPREWSRGICPPDEVLMCQDVRDLLIWASDLGTEARRRQIWSCAVLRVMHTIAHIEGVQRHVYMREAFRQVHVHFQQHMHVDDDGQLWLGQPGRGVVLDKVEWKREKSRESIILKLLHKPANVAETIYDLIGVRLVTRRTCDVMLVLKQLRDLFLVTFPNCNPTRSRNTLIDVDHFRTNLEALQAMAIDQKIDGQQFQTLLTQMSLPVTDERKRKNPHSSSSYRAIQLTCRQLIRAASPEYRWIKRCRQAAREGRLRESSATVERFLSAMEDFADIHGEIDVAFFPFEIQIMDTKSYEANQVGEASHDHYKRSQIRSARRRVLAEVLRNRLSQ